MNSSASRSFCSPPLRLLVPVVAWLLILTLRAAAYLVGAPVTLEKLEEQSDVVFKATAIATVPSDDASFRALDGFVARETEFRVVSVLKGHDLGEKVRFRHYDENPDPKQGGRMYMPQYYHFEAGQTYLVFAKRTEAAGILRQAWDSHRGKVDQGAMRCADAKPVVPGTLKEVVWAELQALLASHTAKDVIYGMGQLNDMSDPNGSFSSTKDFPRADAMKLIGALMKSADAEMANTAIRVISSQNPYMAEDQPEYWLATMASAEVPGIGKRDRAMKNVGGEMYWSDLVEIADAPRPAATRALAIRALGLVRKPELAKPLGRWLTDAEPQVRAAAAFLLADFPAEDAAHRLEVLTADPVPEVRRSGAFAIGFLQLASLAERLGQLLKDPDATVRYAASQSLLTFSLQSEGVEKIFVANLENEEFNPLFLLALAKAKPGPYADQLARVVAEKTEPKNWHGGQVPAYTAFNILFKYLQAQSVEDVRSGKLDRYFDAMEIGYNTGSSEPRDLYAFYLQRSLYDRARAYRAWAKKHLQFDMETFFKQVDTNPWAYQR